MVSPPFPSQYAPESAGLCAPTPRLPSPVSRLPSLVPRPRRTAKRMRPSPRPRRTAKRPRPSPRPPSRRRSGPSAGNAAPRRVGQQALPKEAGSRPGTPVLRSLARGAASRARPGKSPGRGRSPFLVSAAVGGGKKRIIFRRGMYVTKNSSHGAECHRHPPGKAGAGPAPKAGGRKTGSGHSAPPPRLFLYPISLCANME